MDATPLSHAGSGASISKNFSSSANPSLVAPRFVAYQLPVIADQRPLTDQILRRPLPTHDPKL